MSNLVWEMPNLVWKMSNLVWQCEMLSSMSCGELKTEYGPHAQFGPAHLLKYKLFSLPWWGRGMRYKVD